MKPAPNPVLLFLVIFSLLTPSLTAQAAEPDPQNRVSFAALGQQQAIFLQGPLSQSTLRFNVPPEWALAPGATLRLDLTTLISNFMVGQQAFDLEKIQTGQVSVWMNDILLGAQVLQGGGLKSLEFPIPFSALRLPAGAKTHTLMIEWDATASCDQNIAASIAINPASFLNLPHQIVTPPLRLDFYPAPFYLPNNPFAHPVTLIVPDDADLFIVRGAVQIAASLGRLSRGGLDISLLPASQLTADKHAESHLVFIGNPARFDLLRVLTNLPVLIPGQGGLAIVASPLNARRAALLVAGLDGEATFKAASALAGGQILTAVRDDLAFVSDPYQPASLPFQQDQTLAALGVGAMVFQSFGLSRAEIHFSVPAGQAIGPDAYLDLTFNHSQLVDYLRSGIQARINDIPVGSIRLSDASSNLNTARLIIPASAIKSGVNRLELLVEITPRAACSDWRRGSLYVTILPDSFLHLPVSPAPIISGGLNDLGAFPRPFADNELNNVTFVLPSDDPASWSAAAGIAFRLGAVDGGAQLPQVTFDNLPVTGHVIVIGQPGRAPVIASLANVLPMPFDPTGGLIADAQAQLGYTLDASRSTGYLQFASLPRGGALLLIAGNNTQGLGWAAGAFDSPVLRGSNVAVAQSASNIKTRYMAAGDLAPGVGGESALPDGTDVDMPTEIPPRTDGWARWVLGLSILLALALLASVFLKRR